METTSVNVVLALILLLNFGLVVLFLRHARAKRLRFGKLEIELHEASVAMSQVRALASSTGQLALYSVGFGRLFGDDREHVLALRESMKSAFRASGATAEELAALDRPYIDFLRFSHARDTLEAAKQVVRKQFPENPSLEKALDIVRPGLPVPTASEVRALVLAYLTDPGVLHELTQYEKFET